MLTLEAVVRTCSEKISQKQEDACVRDCFFNEIAGLFLWIFQNFYDLIFLQNTSGGCFCYSSYFVELRYNNFFLYLKTGIKKAKERVVTTFFQ